MRIHSTLLPAQPQPGGGQPTLMAGCLDTFVDGRAVVVALAVGTVQGRQLDDVRCSATGAEVIRRCVAHHELNFPDGQALVVGVQQAGQAKQRVRKLLAQAPHGTLLVLLCADGKVYDAAFQALQVDLQSAHPGAQM